MVVVNLSIGGRSEGKHVIQVSYLDCCSGGEYDERVKCAPVKEGWKPLQELLIIFSTSSEKSCMLCIPFNNDTPL